MQQILRIKLFAFAEELINVLQHPSYVKKNHAVFKKLLLMNRSKKSKQIRIIC